MDSSIGELEELGELLGKLAGGSHWIASPAQLQDFTQWLNAESASFRVFPPAPSLTAPVMESTVSLEIPNSVTEAWLARYHRWDPALRVLGRSLERPLLSHPFRAGEWSPEPAPPGVLERNRRAFEKYRREFLLPNGLHHHLGFCLEDGSGRKLFYDFHRGARSEAFSRLEAARAGIAALYLQEKARQTRPQDLPARLAASEPLSQREQEVAFAVARGLSNKEVAGELRISVRTVENHLRAVFAKCGVRSRTRLAACLRRS